MITHAVARNATGARYRTVAGVSALRACGGRGWQTLAALAQPSS